MRDCFQRLAPNRPALIKEIIVNWWKATLAAPALLLMGFSSPSTPRGSHLWDISEVFSNADGTIAFIELEECCGADDEIMLPQQWVTSNAHVLPLGGGLLDGPTGNKSFLIATQGFANLPGAPAPDLIIPNHMLPFFSVTGDSLSYVPYDTWDVPAVPTDGVSSLHRDGTTGPNTPTNYAGETGTVDAGILGVPFCTEGPCPCGNDGGPGHGCLNSSGNGARIFVSSGTSSVSADDMVLSIEGHAPLNSALVSMGSGIQFGVDVGDGRFCSSGIYRFVPFVLDGSGGAQLANVVASAQPQGIIQPGDSRTFQCWARDVLCGPPPSPCPSPCGNNNNLTNGLQVVFTP